MSLAYIQKSYAGNNCNNFVILVCVSSYLLNIRNKQHSYSTKTSRIHKIITIYLYLKLLKKRTKITAKLSPKLLFNKYFIVAD